MIPEESYHPESIKPIVPKHPWRILSSDELDRLQDATYELLEDVGVHFPHQGALEIFAEHGAEVDFEREIVKLEPDSVQQALSTAPRHFHIGGRDPEFDFHLGEGVSFFGPDGCMPFVVDLETGEERSSTEQDVALSARMADYFPQLAFNWTMVSAGDCGVTAPLHELQAGFLNCRKHIQSESVIGEQITRYALEMALAVSGDWETMRARPPLSAVVCCIDPLGQDTHGLETALMFAEAGLPVVLMAMNTLMSTGPATVAGSLAVGNAEVLSAATLVQLAHPGAPLLHSALLAVMEPHTAGYLFSSPIACLMFGAAIELAHHSGLPSLGSWGGTDARAPGWQSAKESGAGFVSALVGAEMSAGVGGLAGATLFNPVNLVLDCDLYDAFHALAGGVEVSEETLALGTTRAVGPRGHYLMEDHTIRHMRDIPFSQLILENNRKSRFGAGEMIKTARRRVEWILDNHHPEPLDGAVERELARIVDAADRELRGDR